MRGARFHMAAVILGGLVSLIGALQVLNPRRKGLKKSVRTLCCSSFSLEIGRALAVYWQIIKLIGCMYQQVLNCLPRLTNAVQAKICMQQHPRLQQTIASRFTHPTLLCFEQQLLRTYHVRQSAGQPIHARRSKFQLAFRDWGCSIIAMVYTTVALRDSGEPTISA
jgi:hypothetical protein